MKVEEFIMRNRNGFADYQGDFEENMPEPASEKKIPLHQKLNLTVNEAALYSNIGQNKIASMLRQPNCPFVLFVGAKKLVKRKEFEEYLRHKVVI